MRPSRFRPAALALLVVLAVSSTRVAAAQDSDVETGGGAFLLLPVGARSVGLGQTGAAQQGSSESAFLNPAGLATMRRSEFSILHASTFISDNTAVTAYFTARTLGVVGVAAYIVDLGPQDVTDRRGVPLGRLSPKNLEFVASYATEITDRLNFGVNYKLIQFRQDCTGACENASAVGTTHATDIGIQYTFGNDRFRIGAVLKHLGFDLQVQNREQADPLPTRIQVGAVYNVKLPPLDSTLQQLNLRIHFDIQDRTRDYSLPDARVGLEFGYSDVANLRAGYAFLRSENSGPTLGIGLKLEGITVDFARVFFTSGNFEEPVFLSFRVLF